MSKTFGRKSGEKEKLFWGTSLSTHHSYTRAMSSFPFDFFLSRFLAVSLQPRGALGAQKHHTSIFLNQTKKSQNISKKR
jgi:hypothetical protein